MNEPNFEIMSKEEFYDVKYQAKNYTLQFNFDFNTQYGSTEVYDEEGNKITDETADKIKQVFAELKYSATCLASLSHSIDNTKQKEKI